MASSAIHWNDLDDQGELDDDVPDLPSGAGNGGKGSDKVIRRRSSKACDQCRKSKCKCERTGEGEPCRSCVLLGTDCTFLGPSRKRGPPKGYIDAIESRLHQLEALLGIIIASSDPRAQSLVDDLSQDTLARDIIARVDNSAFGPKGRKQAASTSRETYLADTDGSSTSRTKRHSSNRSALALPPDGSAPFVTPSNEWQDHLCSRIAANGLARQQPGSGSYLFNQQPSSSSSTYPVSSLPPLQIDLNGFTAAYTEDVKPSPSSAISPTAPARPVLSLQPANNARSQLSSLSPTRRQRRRLDDGNPIDLAREWSVSPPRSDGLSSTESSDSEDLAGAVGQLSLDDHEQVRFHGKASGLHLLGKSNRRDKRIENGIWRFPPARVWPPVLNHVAPSEEEVAARARLPPREQQEHLLELYFTYVHPIFPVVVKSQFLEDFRARSESPYNDADSPASFQSSSSRKLAFQKVPTLLLLAMFALASRFSNLDQPLPPEGNMWDAGDGYLEDAKTVLNKVYASSRPSTCQALLLMSYREIGIGAMAQAWLYVGMAVRMAQDLGLNRSMDKFQRSGVTFFSAQETESRRRIWYACVIMDRYVSTYIGRPLSVYERDFDTPLPTGDEAEEMEVWDHHASLAQDLEHNKYMEKSEYIPMPSRPVATMKASATLASLISMIVQSLYSIRTPASGARHAEAYELEKRLDKWYLDLPEYLRYDPSVRRLPVPPPHIMTLLMNYWTTVLLLHRPFIHLKSHHEPSEDPTSLKAWDMCTTAASHVSSLVSVYAENFCLKRAPAFLSYYVFSAGIMHVTTLTVRPADVQANLGLQQCMDALKALNVLWPSAGRAWELLHGSNVNIREAELARLANADARRKRVANEPLDDDDQRIPSTSHYAARLPAPMSAPPVRPIAVTPSFSTLDPTSAVSGDSFFGPYARWGPAGHYSPQSSQPTYSQSGHQSQPSSATALYPPPLPSVHSHNNMAPQNMNGARYPAYWGEYQEAFSDPATAAALTNPMYSQSIMPPSGSLQQVHPSSSYSDFPGFGATPVMPSGYGAHNSSNRMPNGTHQPGPHS